MGGRAVTRDRAERPSAAVGATELWLLGGTVGQMRVSERRRKESASEARPPRAALRILALFALLLSLTLAAAPSADASAGAFIKAYGWGVSDGASQFETCTSTCQGGIAGVGAGQFTTPEGVTTDSSGDVYVADEGNERIDEFSAAGAFIKAYGWGVSDGASQFETCTSSCRRGIGGDPPVVGAGQFVGPGGVATDTSGDVYVADYDAGSSRIDEFSAAGAFIKAYGWGVSDGASQFETCTSTCQAGIGGSGAGQLDTPKGVATDLSGDVYVADEFNQRIDEFSAAGAFIKTYGWGVADGASRFETCTSTCQAGIEGGGAGQLFIPWDVATDSSGDVYVADLGNERIDEFSAAGAFIEAYGWGVSDGASRFETCTTTCEASAGGDGAGALNNPDGIATDPSGNVYVAEYDSRIDEFSAAGALAAPTLMVSLAGSGSGSVSSSPAGISCGSTCAAQFTAGQTVTLTATPASGSVFTGWSGGGCAGTGTCEVVMSSDQTVTATFTTRPTPITPPSVIGTPLPGNKLTCDPGTWTANPTFTYRWLRGSSTITGATTNTYVVTILDEGQTITCIVGASNRGAAAAPAHSGGLVVGVKGTLTCEKPSGSLSGSRIGPLALGMTRARARATVKRYTVIGYGFDNFCLYGGWGIRADYQSNRIVWMLTANPFYGAGGVTPGLLLAGVSKRLRIGKEIVVGLNDWYFAVTPSASYIFKVRKGIIQEVGIVVPALASTYQAERKLVGDFKTA